MINPELNLTQDEVVIIDRIRSLIGDSKETFVEDFPAVFYGERFLAGGKIYELGEPKGYPRSIRMGGTDVVTASGYPIVEGYKYIEFAQPIPQGSSFLVIYDHFNFSDREILAAYDTNATTFLHSNKELDMAEYPMDLLVLSAGYTLLEGQLQTYIAAATSLQDNDSRFDAQSRAEILRKHLESLNTKIDDYLSTITSDQMLGLKPSRVE